MEQGNGMLAGLIAVYNTFFGFMFEEPVRGITSGRARALAGAGVGLVSLIIGGLAVARSRRVGSGGRAAAIVALVLGVIGVILSVVHLGGAGGFGTGGGRAGAIVALVLSLIGMVLGGKALARARR